MKYIRLIILLIASCVLASSCSTKQNTASSRRWQAFVTRFNVYYNGEQAYIEGVKAQETGLKENYTERIPLFGVGYEQQQSLGKSSFETAITKCEKAIQLHSIKKKPAVNTSKTLTAQQKAYLSRKEFNPYLKHAWLLMGKSQFQKGDFVEAASTFAYITRFYAAEPDVVAEARVWLARCYAELEWFYDAEDVLQRLDRDSVPKSLAQERAVSMADYLIRQDRLDDALPCLQRAAKNERSKAQKARLYYLLGQTYMELGRKDEAYAALGKCVKQGPSYEMALHARILQTEAVTNAANAKTMVKRLKHMARSESNADYIDKIYYAMGNIHLAQNDTLAAIEAYELGRSKAEKKDAETALLLLRLGGVYWDQQRFDKAQPCYTEAIGLLDKDADLYTPAERRSKVLDKLVPPTSAVYLQDSLQWLASLDEGERLAIIDRMIEELKQKEKEEERAQKLAEAEQRQQENAANLQNASNRLNGGNQANTQNPVAARAAAQSGDWYFYNPQLVQQGKQTFQKQWGNRKNEDDWRRSNRSVLASTEDQAYDYAAEDSLNAVRQAITDSLMATGMSKKEAKKWLAQNDPTAPAKDQKESEELAPENDPHERAYYLKDIPFTAEQKASSDSIIRESLYEAAIVEKDQLEDYRLAASTFARLLRDFPDFKRKDEAYYNLFLLYGRWAEKERQMAEAGAALETADDATGEIARANARKESRAATFFNGKRSIDELLSPAAHQANAIAYEQKAESFREALRTGYPNYPMTRIICDPDFERNSRYGRELEDSLYTQTYNAYTAGDDALVERNFKVSSNTFPNGLNRPKFIFVHALSRLGKAPTDTVKTELRGLVEKYPKSDVAEMAAMIVKGLEAGRTLGSGSFTLGSLWSRRTYETEAENAAAGESRALSPERDTPFVFLIAYPTDSDIYAGEPDDQHANSTPDDRLLYDLARFNFSTYVFRGFDITKERQRDITQFRVSGFRNFDDAHAYAQRIFASDRLGSPLSRARIEIISESNLKKLGTLYSFDEYRHFYDSCFAPLRINPELPLEFAPEDGDEGVDYEDAVPEQELYTLPAKTGEGAPEGAPAETPAQPAETPAQLEDAAAATPADDEFVIDDAPVKTADEGFDISADDAAPVKSSGEDVPVDDETAPVKAVDEGFDVSADDAAPVKSSGEDVPVDDEAAPVKTDDGFDISADDEFAPVKKTDDELILDDEAAPAKKTDDELILDDETAPVKKTDDELILDEETPVKTTTTDDEDVYEE